MEVKINSGSIAFAFAFSDTNEAASTYDDADASVYDVTGADKGGFTTVPPASSLNATGVLLLVVSPTTDTGYVAGSWYVARMTFTKGAFQRVYTSPPFQVVNANVARDTTGKVTALNPGRTVTVNRS